METEGDLRAWRLPRLAWPLVLGTTAIWYAGPLVVRAHVIRPAWTFACVLGACVALFQASRHCAGRERAGWLLALAGSFGSFLPVIGDEMGIVLGVGLLLAADGGWIADRYRLLDGAIAFATAATVGGVFLYPEIIHKWTGGRLVDALVGATLVLWAITVALLIAYRTRPRERPDLALAVGGYALGTAASIPGLFVHSLDHAGTWVPERWWEVIVAFAAVGVWMGASMRRSNPERLLTPAPRTGPEHLGTIAGDLLLGGVFASVVIVRPRAGIASLPLLAVTLALRDARARSVERERERLATRDAAATRRVEETQRRLASIVASTHDAIVGMTRETLITEWNAGAEALYGYPADAVLGQPIGMLFPEERAAEAMALFRGVIAGQSVVQHETVAVRRDLSRVDVSLTLGPVYDEDGAIIGMSSIARDISERRRYEHQLQYMADHDPLTGLYNRRRFEVELERELARSRRYGQHGAVLAIDLDHFKYLNDALGHSAGDELITRTGEIMRRRLRATDILARLGGDEFAAVLPEVTPAEAALVASTLVGAIRGEAKVEGQERRVTASIGIAPFEPDAQLTPEELLIEADIAMYDAKEAGRDRTCVYTKQSERQQRMTDRLTWADRIRDALEHDGFTLHAQPIAPLIADAAPRHELLIRMFGHDTDLIPPGTFLYIAERFDLVQAIDRWVLRESIRTLAEHQHAGADIRLHVNVSGRSVGDLDVPGIVDGHLRAFGADGRGLCVEITETAAVVNVERAKRMAHDLGELGCTLALDDFGAGFASFYYLKHLAFDFLKIDGEFISSLTSNPTDQLVVQSIVDIARGLGKRTIAEFVGDAETIELLRRYGVDYVQGYHIARPGSLDAVDLAAAPGLRFAG